MLRLFLGAAVIRPGGALRQLASHRYHHVLVCGDGDLSYSASIAKELADKDIRLTATVLESESEHISVYADSEKNSQSIQEFGHTVRFETDATKLPEYFASNEFDRIQFNFPHWYGKANNKYNRQLLKDFFEAVSTVLKPTGHVETALMNAQGGMKSKTKSEWKQSWMPVLYASNANLMLVDVQPYKPTYNLSSYRFKDERFHLLEPLMFTFAGPDVVDRYCPPHLRFYSHFEIYLTGDPDGERLQDFINAEIASTGCCVQAYLREWPEDGEGWYYKICVFGETRPLTKEKAETIRIQTEAALLKQEALPYVPGRGWSASNPCPASMLPEYLEFSGVSSHEDETLQQ